MPTITSTIGYGWPASPNFTASAETEILMTNRFVRAVYWWTTDDDTAPVFDVTLASLIAPSGERALTLSAGTRLWVALSGEGEVTEPFIIQSAG